MVAYQHHGGLGQILSLEQLPGKWDMVHAHFVNDEDVALDRVLCVLGIGVPVEAEQPVDGAGLMADDLLDSLGGFA